MSEAGGNAAPTAGDGEPVEASDRADPAGQRPESPAHPDAGAAETPGRADPPAADGATPKAGPSTVKQDGDDKEEDTPRPIAEKNAGDWLKDNDRRLGSADLSRLIEDAAARLLGEQRRGGTQYGTYIAGDVYMGRESRIGGDTVGRDRVTGARGGSGAGARQEPTGRVAPSVLAEVVATFVAPPGWDATTRLLAQRRVIVMRARHATGARTAALRLLAGPGGQREVHRLDPDAELRKLLTGATIKKNTSYLVDGLSLDQAAKLRPFLLSRFFTALTERDSWLVITVDSDVRLPRGPADHFVEVSPPAAGELVRSHLNHALADNDATERILADPAVVDSLAELEKEPFDVRRLVAFARDVAALARDEITVEDVRSRLTEQSAADFDTWFRTATERRLRSFLVALAVLDRLPHHVVARAATELDRKIADVERPPAARRRDVFGATRSQRLDLARAEAFDDVEPTGYGLARVEAVRFRNPMYPAWVLDHVWREYDGIHELLIDWLSELGTENNPAVRVRAAAAIGFLSRHSFAYARFEILLPWALSANQREREAAVTALHICAADTGLAPVVLAMLRDWSRPKRNRALRWTAARAWGTGVGRSHPQRALEALRVIAGTDDLVIAEAVSLSMTELLVSREQDLVGNVLDALLEWATEPASTHSARLASTRPAAVALARRLTATLSFLQLVKDVDVEVEDDTAAWPALLWLADRSDEHAPRIAALWRRALVAPHLFQLAFLELRGWARRAERNETQRPALAKLVVATARIDTGTRTGEVLRHHIRQWSTGKNSLPNTARVLLDALGPEPEDAGHLDPAGFAIDVAETDGPRTANNDKPHDDQFETDTHEDQEAGR